MNFGSLMTAMITPFHLDLTIDHKQAAKLAEHLVKTGTESIILAGTTGESPTLTEAEKDWLFLTVKEAVGDKAKIIMGAGSNNTALTIEAVRRAQTLGADGTMLVVPYYNKPSQEGLYEHFKQAAQSSDLPVILYNIPGRCSCNMLPQTIKKLAAVKQIVAVKEASGNLDQIMEIRLETPDDFLIYSGDDSLTLPMLSIGGAGIISVASHIAGPAITAMLKAWSEGNTTLATKLHTALYPLFKDLFIAPNPAPIKYALDRYGYNVNHLRLPLLPLDAQQKKALDQTLDKFDQLNLNL